MRLIPLRGAKELKEADAANENEEWLHMLG